MSTINTNGLNVNYPIPGVNNSSQGFRDNFAVIKAGLDSAGTEITDLQYKVLLKQPLANIPLDNNMGNTVISNAATRGFRATTNNLGNSLSGTLAIDVSTADVYYGTISGNVLLQFTGWTPIGTQRTIELELNIGDPNAFIAFPTQTITTSPDVSLLTLENYGIYANTPYVTAAANVDQLSFRITSVDCGASIVVEPVNRPRQATQIFQRVPATTGFIGDTVGAVCTDYGITNVPNYVTNANAAYSYFTCTSTTDFYLDMPVIFTGDPFGGITAGATYYVRDIPTANTFTISSLPGTVSGPGPLISLDEGTGNMFLNRGAYMYVSTGNFDADIISAGIIGTGPITNTITITNTIATGNYLVCASTNSLVINYPITFTTSTASLPTTAVTGTNATGNLLIASTTASMVKGGKIIFTGVNFGNVSSNTTYYIGNIVANTGPGANLPGFQIADSYANAMSNNIVSLTEGVFGTLIGTYNDLLDNVAANTTYYVKSIANTTHFTISNVQGGQVTAVTNENGTMAGIATNDYVIYLNPSDSNAATMMASINAPVVFNGDNVTDDLAGERVFYIADGKTIDGFQTISVSRTEYNGLAGRITPLVDSNVVFAANAFVGTPIWRTVPLLPKINLSGTDLSIGNAVISGNLTVRGGTSVEDITANTLDANTITSTGTISATILSGNVEASNLSVTGTANIPGLSHLVITGGNNGYYLQTDGSGNLSWAAGTSTPGGAAAGSNTQVQYNSSGSFAASNDFTWNNSTKVLTTNGNVNASNVNSTGGIFTGNLSAANISTLGKVTSPKVDNGTSNIAIATNGNITLGIGGTANVVRVSTANVEVTGNLNATGNLAITGNANVGNIGATGGVFNGNVTGVNYLTANGNIITSNGSITSNRYFSVGAYPNLVAAGTTQNAASSLVKAINIVTTVNTGNTGVRLPIAEAGMRIVVRNNTGNTMSVWPGLGGAINSLGTNNAYSHTASTSNEYFCSEAAVANVGGQWFTMNP